jgi:hypothetical protein
MFMGSFKNKIYGKINFEIILNSLLGFQSRGTKVSTEIKGAVVCG